MANHTICIEITLFIFSLTFQEVMPEKHPGKLKRHDNDLDLYILKIFLES